MTLYAARIKNKVAAALQPLVLKLENESGLHAGHAGTHATGETHFKLHVVSSAFSGLSRLARQRMVYALLADEMRERVHALSLDLKAPEEAI